MELLELIFNKVKQGLPLLRVAYDESISTALINMNDLSVKVNPNFIKKLVSKGFTEEEMLTGILNHEIGHYLYHPFDLRTNLLEINSLKKNNIPFSVKSVYDDFIDNSLLIFNKHAESLDKVYKASETSGVLNILNAYYSKISGLDFGVKELNNGEREQLIALKNINVHCERFAHPFQIKRFYDIFKEEFDSMPSPSLKDLMGELSKQFGDKKIIKELRGLIDEGRISEKTAKDLLSAIKVNNSLNDSLFDKHLLKANDYSIKVSGFRSKSKVSIPFSSNPLSFDNLNDFNPFLSLASGGKPLPVLGKSVNYADGEFISERGDLLNDLVILIDSSGSMLNPNEGLSSAVVSAMTIARHYIINGSMVGVINFSDKSIISDFSDDYRRVCESLFHYQGNGTNLNIDSLSNLLSNHSVCDVVLISDEEISNYDSVINYLGGIKSSNHVYIFSIGNGVNESTDNIKRFYVANPDDIRKIILGGES